MSFKEIEKTRILETAEWNNKFKKRYQDGTNIVNDAKVICLQIPSAFSIGGITCYLTYVGLMTAGTGK
jgi:hypothetical protein